MSLIRKVCLREINQTLRKVNTLVRKKGTTRLWENPLKWLHQAVTLWKFHSEVVFASYHFPFPLLCNVKETYLSLSTQTRKENLSYCYCWVWECLLYQMRRFLPLILLLPRHQPITKLHKQILFFYLFEQLPDNGAEMLGKTLS